MARYDVVYLLKNDVTAEEIKYSIRSVVQNFSYRKIIFVGGRPPGIEPDIYIPDIQSGSTKWERSTHSLKKALKSNEITEYFWLFNDDFFVMDRTDNPKNYFSGSLEKRVFDLKRANPRGSSYITSLEQLRSQLIAMGKDTLSFALHVPMLINKADALALFDRYPRLSMFRSFYGNFYEIPCEYMKDVKIFDLETLPEHRYCSTSDQAWSEGKCGIFLRKYFDKPTKYEVDEIRRIESRELYDEEGNERYEY